ncbi:MAG: hypothetical protein WCF85_12640 [Rhodospirillaceae bacterium]
MDCRTRRHENCIINLPRCDYHFSSQRSCFIGFGFVDSPLEVDILKSILEKYNIVPVEAGSSTEQGLVFCGKICSQIITSQFCAILLNSSSINSVTVPNANVNIEYGMMLGFNKYIIPFVREGQQLPFNVRGIDMVFYNSTNFKEKATKAIEKSIQSTTTQIPSDTTFNYKLNMFLLLNNVVVAPLSNQGDMEVFHLGNHFGFNMLHDFSGFKYVYFGSFQSLLANEAVLRIIKLSQLLVERVRSIPERMKIGATTEGQTTLIIKFLENLEIWVLSNSEETKSTISNLLPSDFPFKIRIISIKELENSMP